MTEFPQHLPLTEFRAVWVYSANMSDAERRALLNDDLVYDPVDAERPLTKPLPKALGLDFVDMDFIDFMSEDELAAFPLSKMLIEGHGMDSASVAPDAAKLDQLRGQVVLVHSKALGAHAPSVEPAPPFTFVGRYSEALKNDGSPMGTVKSAIEPAIDAPPADPQKKKPSDAAMSGRVATIALLVMAVLVWVMIKIAG